MLKFLSGDRSRGRGQVAASDADDDPPAESGNRDKFQGAAAGAGPNRSPALKRSNSRIGRDKRGRGSDECEFDQWPEEMREFLFDDESELYGFATSGAKVCQVVKDSHAYKLGVKPGWYVAAVDGELLPGALTPGRQRAVPLVTTGTMRTMLGARRARACRASDVVRLTFWVGAAPDDEVEWLSGGTTDAHILVGPRASARGSEMMSEDPSRRRVRTVRNMADLKQELVAEFGSLDKAWREALDPSNHGGLGYQEFLFACRKLGIQGDLKGPFEELDANGSGIVSWEEMVAEREVDETKGRCVICTLPNPCPKHTLEDQEEAKASMREADRRKRNSLQVGADAD